ncbi:carbohydrate binding domain-containing protein [Saccharicrinis aurantiacus]|uniref:hypothetical protein n=1 Tax=Saccharicrinis aurantiacus TaxID=1849719 RepID=UPI00083975A8|nr:hypothetical protein [Saccharicrinis aurantiacus]
MKRINIIIGLMLIVFAFGCEKEYEPLMKYSDVQWMSSRFRSENNALGLNNYESFSDLSQGALTHQWSISDTSGIKWLNGNIIREDKDYTKFIREDQSLETTDLTVHALFTKPGVQTVRLYNTYSEFVEFKGRDTIPAIKKGDVWVIDTSFVVDVYDTLQPALKVYDQNDQLLLDLTHDTNVDLSDSLNWQAVELQAGEFLTFVDETVIDRPTGRNWSFDGGSPATSLEKSQKVSFYRLGEFYASSITSTRDGEQIPYGNQKKNIPLKIKVVKSELPFKIVEANELPNGIIELTLNGEIEAFENEESNFTVSYVNQVSGVSGTVGVSSATINAASGNVINLELSEPLYNSDDVTISWSGGSIMSLDQRELDDLSNLPTVMYIEDLCKDQTYFGFEGGSLSASKWTGEWDNQSLVTVSNEQAKDGYYSLRTEINADPAQGKTKMHQVTEKDAEGKWVPVIPIPMVSGKTYIWSFSYYEPDAPSSCVNALVGRLLPWGGEIGSWIQNYTKGEWNTFTKQFTYTGASTHRYMQFQVVSSGNVDGNRVVYFDNISLLDYELRP